MSSITSGGRVVSVMLVLLAREGRDDRFSSVIGRLVRASFNIRVFTTATCRRCSSYITSASGLS